jgi:hypothetical protein
VTRLEAAEKVCHALHLWRLSELRMHDVDLSRWEVETADAGREG